MIAFKLNNTYNNDIDDLLSNIISIDYSRFKQISLIEGDVSLRPEYKIEYCT